MDNINNSLPITLLYGIRLNKPLFLLRVMYSYFLALIKKPVPLKYIDFAFDYRCNLNCRHCFATSLRSNQNQLSIDDYKRIAREALRMGVLHISFQGGEPLLLPDTLEKIIKTFHASLFYIAITTNGTLLTKEKIAWLKKIGVDKITISLDSMDPKKHDAFRRVPGTFAKTFAAIGEVQKQGLKLTINTTITHQNLHSKDIQEIFDYALKNHIIVNPIFAAPVGRWIHATEFMLTHDDVVYITQLQKNNPYLRRDLDSNYFGRGCPAMKEVIYVDPYGNVLPCPFLHIVTGNLKKQSLSDIRNQALKFHSFSTYSPICLAAEDRRFVSIMQKTYKKTGVVPFSLEQFSNVYKKSIKKPHKN